MTLHSHPCRYDAIPTPADDPRVTAAPSRTTRHLTLGPDSHWLVIARYQQVATRDSYGYHGWGCEVEVRRIDDVRPEGRRGATYGGPVGFRSLGNTAEHPAPTVDAVLAAAEQIVAGHGAAWEAEWLPARADV